MYLFLSDFPHRTFFGVDVDVDGCMAMLCDGCNPHDPSLRIGCHATWWWVQELAVHGLRKAPMTAASEAQRSAVTATTTKAVAQTKVAMLARKMFGSIHASFTLNGVGTAVTSIVSETDCVDPVR